MTEPEVEWEARGRKLRGPAEIIAQWDEAPDADPAILESKASRGWWGLLEDLDICLLVTREYEHLVLALSAVGGRPRVSYIRLPHPSGLVADRKRGEVLIAATRNPNQVLTFRPARAAGGEAAALVPVRSDFYPGATYLHDLAFVGGRLMGNSVGQNAVVELGPGAARRVWWPRSLDRLGEAAFSINYLQLNSIAAGTGLKESFFTASAAAPLRRRPGHKDFPVDRRGVVFSGRTRDVIAGGLTRPHSARLHRGRLWVDNSGYGEVGVIEGGKFETVARLPGWTRGLVLRDGIAFVGTSRVIPAYRRYAPGVRLESCGVHAIEVKTGVVQASVSWPAGYQIFNIDWVPTAMASALPFEPGSAATRRRRASELFYRYRLRGGRNA